MADIRILVRGAQVAKINGKVFAVLLSEPEASQWEVIPVDGGIQLIEQETGRFLSVLGTEPYTQAVVEYTDASTPNSRWVARRLDDDDDDAEGVVTDKIQETGLFTLELAGTGLFLTRALHEPRSLLPKKLVLVGAEEAEASPLIFEVQD